MKQIIDKKIIYGMIIGGIIFSGIGVSAAYMYQANQISYTNKDNIEIDVNSALDELYTKTGNSKVTNYTVNFVTTITNTSTGVYGYTWDLKVIPNYQNLILWENLFVKLNQTYISTDSPKGGSTFTYSYDAANGLLTFTASCKQRPNGLEIYVLE